MKQLLLLTTAIILMSMNYKKDKKRKIVFFGDSITQMGVNKNGYIDVLQGRIDAKKESKKYKLYGAGIGGNKVYDLYLRMPEDVLEKKPTEVMIYVGINDVWHKTSGIGTDIVKYERFYRAIIKKLQDKKIKVYVCTPTVIGEKKNNENPQDADLNSYSEVIRNIASSTNCTLIDLRKAFADYEIANNKDNKEAGILTTDRVHLNVEGNKLVADEIAKAMGI
jgi:isoamyl acetate esterase